MSDTATPVPDGPEPADNLLEEGEATSEGFRYLDNGLVVVFIDGTRYLLNRPKAGQYRKLREVLEEHQDAMALRAREVADANRAMVADVPDNQQPPTELAVAVRKANRELQRMIEEGRRSWMREVFTQLAKPSLDVGDDDLPVWFSTEEPAIRLIQHWQRVPSLRGGR